MQYIAFDVHKRYTFVSVESETGELVQQGRIFHERGSVGAFFDGCETGSPVAVETVGNWYWIVEEIEGAKKDEYRVS